MRISFGSGSAWLAAAVCAAALLSRAAAQESTFSPADFSFFDRLGEIRVDLDVVEAERESILVACQGFVEVDGSISDPSCVTRHPYAHRRFLSAVLGAVPGQTFIPAVVDGHVVRVFMSFGVLFNCSGASCFAVPIRNHARHLDEYGLAYSAPQPILADDRWYPGFEAKLDWTRAGMPAIGELIRRDRARPPDDSDEARQAPIGYTVTAVVGVDGTARDPELQGPTSAFPAGSRYTEQIARRSLRSLVSISFVPGFYEGRPTEMRFSENGIVFEYP